LIVFFAVPILATFPSTHRQNSIFHRVNQNPELAALAKRLRRHKPKGGRMSLRAISAELAAQGFLNENGRPFAAASIASMLAG
jgi:hypothetical protein